MKQYKGRTRSRVEVNSDQVRLLRDFEGYIQANVAPSVPRFKDTLELVALAVCDVGRTIQELERESYDRSFD